MADSRIGPVKSDEAANSSQATLTVEDQGVTTFLEDTSGEKVVLDHRVNEQLLSLVKQPGASDIVSFLERPIILEQGNLGVTDAGKLWTIDPFVTIAASTYKAAKLAEVHLLKADVLITLNVNAVRFQTGRYILAFLPSFGLSASGASQSVALRMHTASLIQITQLHHVEIDIATQTHVELEIPFQMIYPAYVNQSNVFGGSNLGFGSLFLYPYVALAAGSSDTIAGYTCWGAFKNIEVSVPTVTQSNFRGGAPGEIEQKTNNIGPISGALMKVSKASTILGEIPMLAPAAATVSWSSAILARAASVFGWSKPIDLEKPCYMVQRSFPYTAVHDQVSTAHPLGLSASNRVSSIATSCAPSHDEMSLDFVKSIYAYFTVASWSAANPAGLFLEIPLSLSNFNTTTYGKGVVPLPVSYPAYFFGAWRGSFKFRFKLVKNEFYSGRLSVAYRPAMPGSTLVASYAQLENCNRVIIDIRETSEFEIICPFVSTKLYHLPSEQYGELYLSIVDPLVAPSTVPSSISIIIEVAGAPDMEYAVPRVVNVEPYAPFSVQSSFLGYPPQTLGKTPRMDLRPAEVAIGEIISSFRQLAKVFSLGVPVSVPSWTTNYYYSFCPFTLAYVDQVTSNAGDLKRGDFYADVVDLISACYGISTGSMRSQFIVAINNTNQGTGWMQLGTDYVSTPTTRAKITGPVGSNSGNFRTLMNVTEGLVDVQVPPYLYTAGRVNANQMINSGVSKTMEGFSSHTTSVDIMQVYPFDGNTTSIDGHRQAGDDWNCYHWISTPCLVVKTVT